MPGPPLRWYTGCQATEVTCNANPVISALYGKCNEDGSCSCNPGYVKEPTTGKCKTP